MNQYYQGSASRAFELRQEKQIGIHDAKRIAKGERLVWVIERDDSLSDTLKGVLTELIQDIYGVAP